MTSASLSRQEILAEIEATELETARRTNLAFTCYTNPEYQVNWHHQLVGNALDRVLAGTCRRLMIFEPPQNGKSEQVSRRFPAYAFGKNPDLHIIACSYNASLAQDMSRDVQKIMSTREYRKVFPETRLAEARFEIDPVTGRRTHAEKRTQSQFDIVNHRGMYNAAGVSGPITGKTADIGIIDDPVKNRAEAESEVYRDRLWEWYKSAFSTRQFGSHGSIIICLTRWHQDDLAGRLLELAAKNPDADQWEILKLPAYYEQGEEIPAYDPRQIGEALWSEKYPLSELLKRRALGEYDFAALYQQKPAPSGGGLFKEIWFANKFVDAAPAVARRARGWDTAATEGDGDYTCGVKISEPVVTDDTDGSVRAAGVYYVEDVVRAQLGPAGVDALMKVTAELDGNCAQREEIEGGASGKSVIEARTKLLAGHDHAGVSITGSKITRSRNFRAQCEAGNVYIVRDHGKGGVDGKGWNLDYIKELCLAEGTLIYTKRGEIPIESVTTSDYVMTRAGWRRVVESKCTSKSADVCQIVTNRQTLFATPNHPILVNGSQFIPAGHLVAGHVLSRYTKALNSTHTQKHSLLSNVILMPKDVTVLDYMSLFGYRNAGRYLMAIISIIKMKISEIMLFQIWNVGHQVIMRNITWLRCGLQDLNMMLYVWCVEQFIKLQPQHVLKHALENAGMFYSEQEDIKIQATQPSANTVNNRLPVSNQDNGFVADVAVLSVGMLRKKQKVFNLEVEDAHEFVANGLLVHNCGFPTAKNDDQVDGSSAAFNAVLLEPLPEPEWVTW